MSDENWIRFEGYEGRLDPGYGGRYASAGIRYPYVERNRTWDIVRVDGEPRNRLYQADQFVLLSRGHDMMKKAHEEGAAYRLHFKHCLGVGRCEDIGHPGGPRRSRAEALGAAPDVRKSTADAPGDPPPPPPGEPSNSSLPAGEEGLPPVPEPVQRAGLGEPMAEWIEVLLPAREVVRRWVAPDLELQVIPLEFELWVGPKLHMRDDCNKRGGRVIGDQGELSCAEVEIVKRLRRAGWDAAWFQAFPCGRRRWSAYIRDAPDYPEVVHRVQQVAGSGGGHPDVIGWVGNRVIAIESKSPTDRLKDSQIAWFQRARAAGVADDDMAVVEWRVRQIAVG